MLKIQRRCSVAAQSVRFSLILVAIALMQSQTPALTDDVLLMSRIRRVTLDSLKTIPSYTCLETIVRRTRASSKQAYKPLDTVQLEVAEFGQRELFAWPGQKNFEAKDGQILGLSSYGEFYSHLKGVMTGSAAIHYAGKEDCEGRPCVRFDFALGQPFTHWVFSTAGGKGTVGESGSFWADPESANLFRLLINAQEIPVELGIRAAELDIRYGATNLIGSHPSRDGYFISANTAFQLPQNFSLHMTMNSGEESQNTVSFTQCREYQSESKLLAEPAPERTPESQVQEITLPAHLTVGLSLTAPVRSGVSHVGDRVEAVIDRDVKKKDQLFLPKGAQVIGRVRRMEHYSTPYEFWIAALEFTDVAFKHDAVTEHARFTGALQFYDPLPGVTQDISTERTIYDSAVGTFGPVQNIRREKLIANQLPGVGTFLSKAASVTFPKGFHMTWLTTALP